MTVLQKLYTSESWDVTGDQLGTVYHGGKRKITQVDASKLQSRDHGFYGKGFYATRTKSHAKTYGQHVSAFKVHPKAKVLVSHLNPAEAHPELVSAVKRHYFDSGKEAASKRGKLEGHRAETEAITGSPTNWHHAVTKYAHDKNYDVVKHSDGEIVVRNPKVLSHVKESLNEADVSREARDKSGKWTAGGPHPSKMHAKHINAELDALDDERSAHADRMIAAGRGHERADETHKKAKTDPNDHLAQHYKKISDRHYELRSEIEARYGPNPPRRLPTHKRGQFGPRVKESLAEEDSFADFYERTSSKNRKGIERAVAAAKSAETKKDLGGVREFGKGGKAFGGEKEGLLARLKSRLRDAIGAHRASRELARKAAQDRDTRPATTSAAHHTTGKFHLDQSRKALAASKSAFQHHDKGGQRAVMLHRTAATLNYSAADASKAAMDDKLHQHHSKLHVTHRRAMKELRSSEGGERKPTPRSAPEDFAAQQSDKATKAYHEAFRAHRTGDTKAHALIKQHRKAMALHRSAHDELKNAGDDKKAEHHRRMHSEHRHAIEKLRGAKSMAESVNEASDAESDVQVGRELTATARAATKAAREAQGRENKYRAHTDAYDSHREAYEHHLSTGNKKFAAAHKRLARAHKERVHKYGPRGWYESIEESENDNSHDLRRLSSVAYKMSKHAHKVNTHEAHLRAANAHDRAYSRLQDKNKKAAYEHRSMADTHYSILSRKMSESIEEDLPHTNTAIGHSSIAHDASARARKSNKPADHKTAIRLHFRAAESHKLAASKSAPGTASHAYHLDHAAEHDTHVKDHRQVLKGMGAMAHESSLVLLRLYETSPSDYEKTPTPPSVEHQRALGLTKTADEATEHARHLTRSAGHSRGDHVAAYYAHRRAVKRHTAAAKYHDALGNHRQTDEHGTAIAHHETEAQDHLRAIRSMGPWHERRTRITKESIEEAEVGSGDVPHVSKWSRSAGGTGAAVGKYGYTHATAHGTYHVSPFTTKYGRHAGYSLRFSHTDSDTKRHIAHAQKIGSGLWHDLGVHRSPHKAANAAKAHHEMLLGVSS